MEGQDPDGAKAHENRTGANRRAGMCGRGRLLLEWVIESQHSVDFEQRRFEHRRHPFHCKHCQ
jgi:hypothetical protein